MFLANAIDRDENALICDLAETYHIYEYKSLPPRVVAIFCIGLGNDSRIKRKFSDQKENTNTLLLALLIDEIRDLKRGLFNYKGNKKQESIFELMQGLKPKSNKSHKVFSSSLEFERARKRILEGE